MGWGKKSGRVFSRGRSALRMRARRARGPLAATRQLKEESNFERLQSRHEITQSACRAEAVFRIRQVGRTDGSGRELPGVV